MSKREDRLYDVLRAAQREIYSYPNVRRIAVGRVMKDGKPTGELGLIVGVSQKLPIAMLTDKQMLPSSVFGVRVDVQHTGEHRIHPIPLQSLAQLPDYDCSWYDTMQGGVGLAHYLVTGGTLGTVDPGLDSSVNPGVSNNHVLALENDAQLGDPIMQPSPYCQVTNRTVGTLLKFKPIIFVGGNSGCPVGGGIAATANAVASLLGRKTRLQAVLNLDPFQTMNTVDVGFMQFAQGIAWATAHMKIGEPTGNRRAQLGEIAIKRGARTDVTMLQCSGIHATVGPVGYGNNRTAFYEDQDVWTAYQSPYGSGPGDSGSILLGQADLARLCLLFAGSDVDTIASPYEYVQQAWAS